MWSVECAEGSVTDRLCGAAEIKSYFDNLQSVNTPPPNQNCNSTSWGQACESGWSAAVVGNTSLAAGQPIPERTLNPLPCCAGFFCPRGLSCMLREYFSPYRVNVMLCGFKGFKDAFIKSAFRRRTFCTILHRLHSTQNLHDQERMLSFRVQLYKQGSESQDS